MRLVNCGVYAQIDFQRTGFFDSTDADTKYLNCKFPIPCIVLNSISKHEITEKLASGESKELTTLEEKLF